MDEISVDLTLANYPIYNFTQSNFIDTDIEKNVNFNLTSEEESERFRIDENIFKKKDKISRRSYSISDSIDKDELCSFKFQDHLTNDGYMNNKIDSKEISIVVGNNCLDESCLIQSENFVENKANSFYEVNKNSKEKYHASISSGEIKSGDRKCFRDFSTDPSSAIRNGEETFSHLIKEFLKIENFPTEKKQKAILIKKFSSIYKKIKLDKTKANNFIGKLSLRVNEQREDIYTLLEFEILRNKREASFTSFLKNFKKFVTYISEKKILNFSNLIQICNIKNEFMEKLEQIRKRIKDYLTSYENILKYLNNSYTNSVIIENFGVNFKLSKFSSEEGKEKLIRKIKESFENNNICYLDHTIEEIFFRNEINIISNSSYMKKDYANLVSSHANELSYISATDSKEFIKNLDYKSFNEEQKNNETFFRENIDLNMKPKQIFLKLENKAQNQIIKSNSFNFIFKKNEYSLPVMSRKYYTKKYDNRDFIQPNDNWMYNYTN